MRPRLRSALLPCLAAGLLSACADSDELGAWAEGKDDSGGASLISPNSAFIIDVIKRNPDGTIKHKARIRELAHTAVAGAQVQFSNKLCELWFNTKDAQLDEGLYENQPARKMTAALVDIDDRLSLRVAPDAAGVMLVGARLRDPRRDAMPQAPNDPAVFDADGDGNPGMSVVTPFGRVYSVLRTAFSFEGALTGRSLRANANIESIDFVVLGDGIPFVDAKKELAKKPLIDSTWRGTYTLQVRLMPLAGNQVGCGDVNAIETSPTP